MTATSLDLSQIKTDALSSAAAFRTLIGLGSSDAVTFKEATLTSGAVTSSAPVINATQTWNNGATTFTGMKLNVTDTASASASLLMDVQVGGVSKETTDKSGNKTIGGSLIWGAPYKGELKSASFGFGLVRNSNGVFYFGASFSQGALLNSSLSLGWAQLLDSTPSLRLYYDAANTLAQRNGTNAQTFRLYNTYTSSTSFERLNVRWATNELIIDAEAGSGGGTLRGIKLGSATTSLLGFYGATPVDQPPTVADPSGGGTVDTEARTAIGEIVDRLQELGLIA